MLKIRSGGAAYAVQRRGGEQRKSVKWVLEFRCHGFMESRTAEMQSLSCTLLFFGSLQLTRVYGSSCRSVCAEGTHIRMCMHTCIHKCTHACMHTHTHSYTHTHACNDMHARMHTHTNTHTRTLICICRTGTVTLKASTVQESVDLLSVNSWTRCVLLCVRVRGGVCACACLYVCVGCLLEVACFSKKHTLPSR